MGEEIILSTNEGLLTLSSSVCLRFLIMYCKYLIEGHVPLKSAFHIQFQISMGIHLFMEVNLYVQKQSKVLG